MKISENLKKWYLNHAMVHACWENWDTEDFFEALATIRRYEDKVEGVRHTEKRTLIDTADAVQGKDPKKAKMLRGINDALVGIRLKQNIENGVSEYENDILSMSNTELWDHCFADGDIKEDDFCTQVLKKRLLSDDT
jgi:glucan phosphorylase